MDTLRAKGGIFQHGGPPEPFAVDNSAAYNDGVLGRLGPAAQCHRRCAMQGRPTRRCVSRCIKRSPLLGLGQEDVSTDVLSHQIRVLTLATGFTGLLVAGLLVHQMVTRTA